VASPRALLRSAALTLSWGAFPAPRTGCAGAPPLYGPRDEVDNTFSVVVEK